MTEKQLKKWLKSSPSKAPECYLIGQTGGGKYMIQVVVKQTPSLLCDNLTREALRFSSLSQAKNRLVHLGINKLELHLSDPYGEMGALERLNEKIKIPVYTRHT